MRECNTPSFDGQEIFCGIDVHKNRWWVCIRKDHRELGCHQMEGSVPELLAFLKKKFPGATVHSAYEAGFCGFAHHRQLVKEGIHNIVVNPADIPTTGKEREGKCDRSDCAKLAKHLEDGSLTPIYVPSEELEKFRGLVRQETHLRDEAVRAGNRLKAYLRTYGLDALIPRRWSDQALKNVEEEAKKEAEKGGSIALSEILSSEADHLKRCREARRGVVKAEGAALKQLGLEKTVQLLTSIPGIGFRSAVVLLSEICDINRFKSRNHFASFVGLAPHAYGSGEHERDRATGCRKQKQLHYLLIQAAWVAIAKDLGFSAYFGRLCSKRKQKKTRAIVSVAKKLLLLVYAVLREGKPYDAKRLFDDAPEVAKNKEGLALSSLNAWETVVKNANTEDAVEEPDIAALVEGFEKTSWEAEMILIRERCIRKFLKKEKEKEASLLKALDAPEELAAREPPRRQGGREGDSRRGVE